MPVSSENIDSFTKKLSKKIGDVQAETIKALLLLRGEKTSTEFIALMDSLNVKQIVNSKAQNVFRMYDDGLALTLKETISFSQISGVTLEALAQMERLRFYEEIGTMAMDLKKVVIEGVMLGHDRATMIERLRKVYRYEDYQLEAVLNTGLSAYSRTVTKMMMDSLPDTQKYIYVGPIDDRTRSACVKYWGGGAKTLSEIKNEGWEESLIVGGGINCRHQWTIEEAGTPFYDVRGEDG